MKMSSPELSEEQVKKMIADFNNAERGAIQKDKQISELLSRLREYEMGEYGLSEAVAEIKECKKLLRLRDREIEILTDQLNVSKLQVLALTEKFEDLQSKVDVSHQQTMFTVVKAPPCIKKPKKLQKPKIVAVEGKPVANDKACQCYISVYPLNSLKQMSAVQIQNEKLRIELGKVCEEAIELLTHMKKEHKNSRSHYKSIINNLQEKLEDLEVTIMRTEPLSSYADIETFNKKEGVMHQKSDPADCYKSVLQRIEQEDIEVQEIFHELANQIKVLKQNQTTLVRHCQALSDYGIQLHKENERLRKIFSSSVDFISSEECKVKVDISSSQPREDVEKAFLHDIQLSSLNGPECTKPGCIANRENIVKLVDLVTEFLKEVTNLKNLLEVSHHQTKVLESICFTKETELKAAMEQLILFQIQSDERLLLGKLALKVLQLQFSNAACTQELKKYKLDKTTLQEWYAALLKDHEQNEVKLSTAYAKAHTRVKHLMETLQDIGQRCSEAVSSYEQIPT